MSCDVELRVKRVNDLIKIPSYAHDGDMAFDIPIILNDEFKAEVAYGNTEDGFRNYVVVDGDYTSNSNTSLTINPDESVKLHTGLYFETDIGLGMKVYVRSSVGIKKNLVLSNGTGIIDTATYRGELIIALTNIGNSPITISNGDRICQAEIVKIPSVSIVEIDELSKSERGEGGLGSTGK